MKGPGLSWLLRVLGLLMLLALVVAQDPTSTEEPPPPSSSGDPPPQSSQEPPPSSSAPPPEQSSSGAPESSSSGGGSSSSSPPATTSGGGGGGSSTHSSWPGATEPPDVMLRVPELSVGRIELDVDNLRADINLAAEIANIVTLNVGVQVGIEKVNITIADVFAELELIIRLGHLVDIVNRTLASLDLNPLLINLLNEVTDIVDSVVGAVDGLLGSILQGNTKLNFIIDNLGNIIQEVVGEAGGIVSSIVGNYQNNMTFTGVSKQLGNGLTQKTYKYDALGSLVNIITNTLGQVVQAVVVGKDGSQGGGGQQGGGNGDGDDDEEEEEEEEEEGTTTSSAAPEPTGQATRTTS